MTWQSMFSTTMENERVRLRPLQASDRDALSAIVFDPDIWRYFVSRIDDEAGLDRFIETGLADIEARKRAVFVVIDKPSNKIAGSMCYGNLAEADGRLEIGWSWLGAGYRGTGVNRFAKLALLTYAFGPLGCARVEFKTDVLNEPARRGLRNIGAKEEGVFRSYNVMPGGRRRDAVYYSILAAEWPDVKTMLSRPEKAMATS
ncbi:GNAT family N-acetyltransferase [uncultured Bradyrhizobium sp.]|uniref:GNAT family N-acetyltransferase n=1 Tax=uncultured Bradyrhizobium sp. TaxID=199684 RepID=UPI0035CC9A6C